MEPARPAAPCRLTGLCLRRHPRHGERAPGGTARPGERVAAQGTPVPVRGPCKGTRDTHSPPNHHVPLFLSPFVPPISAAPRLTPPAPAHSEPPSGERSAVIYSVNFPADEARVGVTFPALPLGWQPPTPAH